MKRVFGASHMSDLQLQHFNIGICHNSGLASWHECGNVVLPGSFVVQLQSEYLGILSSAPRGNLMEMHSYAGSTWAGHCVDAQLIAHIWKLCWKCQKHCFRLFEWNLHTFALRQWPHYQFKLLQIQFPPPKKNSKLFLLFPSVSSSFPQMIFAHPGSLTLSLLPAGSRDLLTRTSTPRFLFTSLLGGSSPPTLGRRPSGKIR